MVQTTMTVTCPQCETSYDLDSTLETGRKLKCSLCGCIWNHGQSPDTYLTIEHARKEWVIFIACVLGIAGTVCWYLFEDTIHVYFQAVLNALGYS